MAGLTMPNRREISGMIAGMMLGDSYIHAGLMTMNHGPQQREYLLWKAELLNNLTATKFTTPKHVNNTQRIRTKVHPLYKAYESLVYQNGRKQLSWKWLNRLTPLGLAIWYMDDGCMKTNKKRGIPDSKRLYWSTHKFTYEEHEMLQRYFLEKWNVRFNITKRETYFLLSCGKREAQKLFSIIGEYAHPTMAYKFDLTIPRRDVEQGLGLEDVVRSAE